MAESKTDITLAKVLLSNGMTVESHRIKGKKNVQLLLLKNGKTIDHLGIGPITKSTSNLKDDGDFDPNYFKVYKSFDLKIPFFEISIASGSSIEIGPSLTQIYYIHQSKITKGPSFESIGQGEGGLLREFDSDLLISKKQIRLLVGIDQNQKKHLPKLNVVRSDSSPGDEANLMVVERYWTWTGSVLKEIVNFDYSKLPID